MLISALKSRLAARFVRGKIAVLENQRGAGGLPIIRSLPPFRRGLGKDPCLTKKIIAPDAAGAVLAGIESEGSLSSLVRN